MTRVTFSDLMNHSGLSKGGYKKIEFCRDQAVRDGLNYFWIDTCCIDKSNNAELSEALVSMYRWYQSAARCYVYLVDVSKQTEDEPIQSWMPAFRDSRYWTRGWTLQELIAPSTLEFFFGGASTSR